MEGREGGREGGREDIEGLSDFHAKARITLTEGGMQNCLLIIHSMA